MRKRLQTADDSTLRGVMVCELGEAEGHGFAIGREFLEAVVEIGNKSPVKVRANHPAEHEDVLSIVGEATNFRLDGDCVRADVKMFDIPHDSTREKLIALAQQAGHLFGMSLDFAGEQVKKAGTKLKTMTCEAIYGLDFVGTPAATRALFSAGKESNHWRVCGRLDMPKVDDAEQMRTKMTKELLVKLCKKFEIDAKAKDAEAQVNAKLEKLAELPAADEAGDHPEPDGDEGYEKIMSALGGIEKRLAALESKKDGEKVELAEDEPVAEEEEKEEQMATMAAKVCSIMLAKVGIKPRGSKPQADDATTEVSLSADEQKMAKELGLDHKQFAANLAKSKQVKF